VVELNPFAGQEHFPFQIGEGSHSLLLIHGFPGTPADVRPLAERLTTNGWRAHGPLLPGFGEQIALLDTMTRQVWLESLRNTWKMLSPQADQRVLLGYSMGAALAIVLAGEFQPDATILINPFWRAPHPLARLVPVMRKFGLHLRPFRKANFDDPRLKQQLAEIIPHINLEDVEVQESIREQFVLPIRAIDEILSLGREAYRKASMIEGPLMMLQGREDALVHPKYTRRLLKRFGSEDVQYHEIDGDHHLLESNSSSLEEVGQLVNRFLEGLR
jgi:carboxylesterase